MTFLGIALFVCVAVTLGTYLVLAGLMAVRDQAEEREDDAYSEGPLFKMALPFIQYFGKATSRVRFLDRTRRDLDLALVRAGKSFSINSDEFIGMMVLCGLIGMGIGVYLQWLGIGKMVISVGPKGTPGAGVPVFEMSGVWMLLGMFMMGAMMPRLQLKEAIAKRQKAVLKVLPYTLDLLCLAVEAGLDFTAALNRIGEKLQDNPFRDEIRTLTRDLSMGKTRAEALRDMEKRVGLEDLTSVVSALVQADELGASLGPTLRIQSAELQRRRFQRAEKKAMQAPVLMLIPLVLFIFPLVFMIIFGPMALRIIYGGGLGY